MEPHLSITLENPSLKWMRQLSFPWLKEKKIILGKRGDDKPVNLPHHVYNHQCMNAFTKNTQHRQSICHQATKNSSGLTLKIPFQDKKNRSILYSQDSQHTAREEHQPPRDSKIESVPSV